MQRKGLNDIGASLRAEL